MFTSRLTAIIGAAFKFRSYAHAWGFAHNARPREPRPRRGRIQHEGYYGHRYRRPRMDRRRR